MGGPEKRAVDGWDWRRLFADDRIWVYLIAWFAMMAGSFANFLNYNHYPIVTVEVGVIVLGMAIAATGIGALHAFAARLQPVMDALLVFLAIDLNSDGQFAPIIAVTILAVGFVRKCTLAPIFAVIFSVVLGAQLVSSVLFAETKTPADKQAIASKGNINESLPAIVHIVLDEHIGIEGLDAADPVIARTRQRLIDAYDSEAFTVFGGAYGRYFRTAYSMPEILNFGKSAFDEDLRANHATQIKENAYFDRLEKLGYEINILQSDFVDYCAHPAVSQCDTYQRSGLESLSRSQMPAGSRAKVLAAAFVSLSPRLLRVATYYDVLAISVQRIGMDLPVMRLHMLNLASSLAALDTVDDFVARLRDAKPGNVYFAHLLLPHYPYVTREDCTIKPLSQWKYRRYGGDLTERTHVYAEQLVCAWRLTKAMLDAVKQSSAGDNIVFIVHGDHGSRITNVEPRIQALEHMHDRELIAGYSTLFALRLPQTQASYDPSVVPVSVLLKNVADNGFTRLPEQKEGEGDISGIYIEDEDWKPTELRGMPRFRYGASLRENKP